MLMTLVITNNFKNNDIFILKQNIMYKNFNLTESEKEQILNLHKEKGYKTSINEQTSIPKPTTSKFMPPPISDDPEPTKPEPGPETYEEAAELNKWNQKLLDLKKRGLISPEGFMNQYNRSNPSRPIKTPNDKIIPYVTTDKFMPPARSNEPEYTKPEPPADDRPLDEQYGDAGNYEMNALSSERYQDEYQDYMDELSPEQQESFKQLEKYETHLIHIANKMRENSMGKYRKPNDFMDLLINKIPFYNDDININ